VLFSYWSWGTLKVTDSHVQCTSGNISETVQESDVFTNRKWYIAYLTAPFQITLSDFQGHLPITSLLRGIFRIVVQQLKRFNLYCVARFLCKGWASCYIYLTFLCFYVVNVFLFYKRCKNMRILENPPRSIVETAAVDISFLQWVD